jgi:hypothetical protein
VWEIVRRHGVVISMGDLIEDEDHGAHSDDSDRIWNLSSSDEEDVQAPPPAPPAPPSGRTLSKRTRIHNGPAELDPSRRRHLKPVPGEAGFEQGR